MVNYEEKEKLNSYEFRYGGVDTKIKIYFTDAEDLETQIVELNKRCNTIRHNTDSIKSKFGENAKRLFKSE